MTACPIKPAVKASALRCGITRGRGFTLVELVVSIAVLSIALLAVAKSLAFSAQFAADPLWQTRTVQLAQAYSAEILSQRFDQNSPLGGTAACGTASVACSSALGPDAGERRSGGTNSFNDVDDYHGLNDSPPVDSQGRARSDYNGYRVEVDVRYADADFGLSGDAEDNGAKHIEIRITAPGQPAVPFSVYLGNY